MHEAALVPLGITATASTVTRVELGLATVAVVLFLVLLAVRAKRDHDQRIRKASSVGYYDPDAARYLGSPLAPDPAGTVGHAAPVPLAPTFVAPGRTRPTRRGSPKTVTPQPVPASFGAVPNQPPGPVPAFDPAEAVRARPMTAAAPATAMPALPSPPPPGIPMPPGWDRPPPPDAATPPGR